MSVITRTRAIGLALASGLFSNLALACPVCFIASEETRGAYIGTTVLMSLLPLAMAGGLVLWLRRRFREAEDAASR